MCTYLPAFDRYCPVKPTRRMWEYWDLYVDYVMAYLTLKILTLGAETSMLRRSAELSVVMTMDSLLCPPVRDGCGFSAVSPGYSRQLFGWKIPPHKSMGSRDAILDLYVKHVLTVCT